MSWRVGDEIVACKICRMQDQWCPEVAHWLCPALPAGVDLPDMQRMLGAWIDESDAARLPSGRRAITDKKIRTRDRGLALLLPPSRTDPESA